MSRIKELSMSTSINKSVSKVKKTMKRIRPSMKKETILAADYNRLILPFSCEDCSHFSMENTSCTLGLNPIPHLAATQKKTFELSGQMALCRFQEID